MLRRLAKWLLLSMGILALASPVLACEMLTSPVSDCCPEGTPSPCEGGVPAANVTCCASAPATAQVAAIEAHRPSYVFPSDDHAPNPLILAAWLHSFDGASVARVPLHYIRPRPGGSDQQIYLQTRRLRL